MLPFVLMMQADPDDQLLTDSAFSNLPFQVTIRYAKDFEEMEDLINEYGQPIVILLNDQGAAHPGGELLLRIKSHVDYDFIPVVILGEYSTPEYIRRCYSNGASTFNTKPVSIKLTQEKIEKFFSYWLEVANF